MKNPLRLEKIRKQESLLEKGLELYPHIWKKLHWKEKLSSAESLKAKIKDVSEGDMSKDFFCLAGRLMRKRPMGKAAFFTLQDQSGQFQCYIRKDSFVEQPEFWDLWKLSDIGDIFAVRGQLFRTKKGEPSLKVQDLKILCKSLEPLPEKYHGLEDIELKYRFRHLDLLMNPDSRKIFQTRSQIIQEIRAFMSKAHFMEVETPVLQPIYGGAVAEPFETHFRRLGNQKMYLKISPEIYLKKLIVGGFEKVYEIGKNFRNEGIDRTHNPEFTMMEYYEAYTDYKDQLKFFKKLVNHVVKKIKGELVFSYQGRELNFKKWEILSVKEAVKKYSRLENNRDQENLEEALKLLPESKTKLEEKAQEHLNTSRQTGRENLKQEQGKAEASAQNLDRENIKFLDPDKISFSDFFKFIKKLEPKGEYQKFETALSHDRLLSKEDQEDLKGELTVLAFEILAEKHLWNPTFIIDFPLAVSPLTKSHRKRQRQRLVERFEPYIAGMELGNAYTELNDPVEQRKRLTAQQRWSEASVPESQKQSLEKEAESSQSLEGQKDQPPNSQEMDENFLHALEVGMPPTGGVGLGIERLVMILTDQKSIRDCILFPAQKNLNQENRSSHEGGNPAPPEKKE